MKKILLVAVTFCLFVVIGKAANVEIPDVNFKAYLLENFDRNSDGEISTDEARQVRVINAVSRRISSLKGIEACVNLDSLRCSGNKLASINLSKNLTLRYLSLYFNQLTTLDLSKNRALNKLICYQNQLKTLDLSNNPALEILSCYNNQLTSVNISKNTVLKEAVLNNNLLTTLDVRQNRALKILEFNNNKLTSIDLVNNKMLWYLRGSDNLISSFDFTTNTKLVFVDCQGNRGATTGKVKVKTWEGFDRSKMHCFHVS